MPPAGLPITEHTDFRGNVITIGDLVLYAALSGRSCQLVEATVLGILDKGPKQYGYGQQTSNEIKFQLMPTGRSSRWKQHWTATADEGQRPVWVMAENIVKPS